MIKLQGIVMKAHIRNQLLLYYLIYINKYMFLILNFTSDKHMFFYKKIFNVYAFSKSKLKLNNKYKC